MTKDRNSTLLLYLKHSQPVTFTSHQEAPIQESAEEKKNRKEAIAVSNERKGAAGCNPSSSLWPLAAVTLPLAWVGQETAEASGNSKSLHLCSGCPHICFMASPPSVHSPKLTLPRKPRRFPLCLRPPFLFLWFYMSANWLDLLSFPRCVKGFRFELNKENLKQGRRRKHFSNPLIKPLGCI